MEGWWPTLMTSLPCSSQIDISLFLTAVGFPKIETTLRLPHLEQCFNEDFIIAVKSISNSQPIVHHKMHIVIDRSLAIQRQLAYTILLHMKRKNILDVEIQDFNALDRSSVADMGICVFLLEYQNTFWDCISAFDFRSFQSVLARMKGFLWATKDIDTSHHPRVHVVDGLARVLRSENPKRRITRLNLDSQTSQLRDVVNIVDVLLHMIKSPMNDVEAEFEERDGALHINRVIQSPAFNTKIGSSLPSYQLQDVLVGPEIHLAAQIDNPGTLSTVKLVQMKSSELRLGDGEIIIEVIAIGITGRDYLIVSGKLNDQRIFNECSGIVRHVGLRCTLRPGDRVMAVMTQAFTTFLRCKESYAVAIPTSMSFEDAAGLPVSMMAAFYSIMSPGDVSASSTVLIHHASGALGQACIQATKHLGATIMATASTEAKRELIRKTYGIPYENVLPANDPNLPAAITNTLGGSQVDLAVSCVQSDLRVSLQVIGSFGRITHLGIHNEVPVATRLHPESKCVSYSSVDIVEMCEQRPNLIREAFKQLFPLIQKGIIRPAIPLHKFSANALGEALKWFRDGSKPGKVVVDFSRGQTVPAFISNLPDTIFSSHATYVIAGGFGGIGRCIAYWMAERGARNLLIISRSGPRTDAARSLIAQLSGLGVRVESPCCDITARKSLQILIESTTRSMPPIRGCINSTMILRDAMFENMTHSDFVVSSKSKVEGSWNLHLLLPRGMDFFVMLSSIVGILGGPSQANYAAGNTYKDALARYRVMNNEKAVSINLGMMVTDGVVVETKGMLDSLRRRGWFKEITRNEFLALLEYYCNPLLPLLHPEEAQIIVGIETPAAMEGNGIELPEWIQRPLFRQMHLIGAEKREVITMEAGNQASTFEMVLRGSSTPEEAAAHATAWILERLSHILGTPISELDANQPLHSNGINSLLAVELRLWFEKSLNTDIATFTILGNNTILELGAMVVRDSGFLKI